MPSSPILFAGPDRLERPVDLVFVHGMSSGAWLWERDVIPWFAERGWRCWAPDLATREDRALGRGGIERYTDRLAETVRAAGRPVVVIGHSLGGAVAQNLLRRGGRLAGLVLLCSVPPYGLGRASAEMLAFRPKTWATLARLVSQGMTSASPKALESIFLPGGAAPEVLDWLTRNLTDEAMAAMVQAMGWRPIAPPPVWLAPFLSRPPVLVIGGSKDLLVPPTDVGLTALWHGGRAHVIPGAGHMPMLEHEAAEEAAALTLDWLEGLEGQKRAA